MKKTLLLLASAALLLVGCAKEQLSNGLEGELTKVTFTASLESGVATKADIDTDGKGAYVNRCIMEIYFQNQLYKRMVQPSVNKVATFANVPVVAGKEYQILFWADHVDNSEEAEGLATDKYYNTQAGGLKAVQIIKESFIDALEEDANTNDYLDAFFGAKDYTVTQAGGNFNIKLRRPFAQLNVITTDVGEGKTVTSAALLPEKVSVSYTAATTFNVADSTVTGSATYAYEAPVYGDWSTVATYHELTLSMDYILASTEQGAVDVTFKTKNGETVVMNHSLTNLPYKRNYRTNVKGDLLTTAGSWTATINPIWGEPDIVKVVEVADIKSANQIINQYASMTKQLEVKFTAEPNDSGVPAGEEAGIRAIVTTPIQQDASLSIEVLTPTKELYIGDYKSEYIVSGEDVIKTDANHAVVNVNVPESSSIVKLVINAPSKSVYINGKEVANVGIITNLDAITSQNTLIIEKDQQVGTLTIRQGGLEIHGTVGEAIVPEGHGTILVRDCENLKETEVYNVLKDHIAPGYVGVKGRTTEGLWDIIPAVCQIGEKSYGSLIDAVAAVQSGETINLVRDYEGDGVVVPGGKNFTLDFGGHTYKVIDNMAGSAGTQNQCFQLLKGSTLVFQNGTITTSCAKLGINTYSNITISNLTIDMTGTEATGQVACLETCNGNVSIEGNTNLIAKEGQIATLVLYWPNGGYGDINLTMNTTGEVSGLMAYGSYQVQDLSTVAQHSHVSIMNGKYDVTFDMDNLDNYDYKISGGVFSEKPDASLIAEHFDAVANTDAATSEQYPWKVKVDAPAEAELFITKPGQAAEFTTLKEFRNATNEGKTFAGCTVTLLKDIDLNNEEWTPISNYAYGAGSDKLFAGTFDGDNHTISNLKIASCNQDALGNTENVARGFFGQVATCTIKNLKFSNANVSSEAGLNAIVASLHPVSTGKLIMDNVQVLSGSVSCSTENAGGLMAFCAGWAEFTNCVNYASVSGYGVGGIVGILRDGAGVNTCVISDCINYGAITNTVGTGDGAGGIVSKIQDYGLISRCKNYGEIKGTVGNVYAAGILGIANCGNGKPINITDCVNYASITSDAGDYGRAGGIVAKWSGSYLISHCVNSGNITGYQGAGGIVGWSGDSWGLTVKYSYNSGSVTASHGNAGGIDQGEANQTVLYSLNSGGVSCAEGKKPVQISNSTSTITSCYYYEGNTLKDKDGVDVANVDTALESLNTDLSTPFWGKDNNIIKPLAIIQQ